MAADLVIYELLETGTATIVVMEFVEGVTEYSPGAAIGWHRDAAPFDQRFCERVRVDVGERGRALAQG